MQLSNDYEAGLTRLYPTIMDMARHVAHSSSRPLKAIAADMGKSPTELSRILSDNPNDPRRFDLADLPAFIHACGERGKLMVHWLNETFLGDPEASRRRAMEALASLAPVIGALVHQAGLDRPKRAKGRKGRRH